MGAECRLSVGALFCASRLLVLCIRHASALLAHADEVCCDWLAESTVAEVPTGWCVPAARALASVKSRYERLLGGAHRVSLVYTCAPGVRLVTLTNNV